MNADNQITCLNCNNEFNSEFKFCPHCGQSNKSQNLNFKYVISEFLAANFNLDSKIFSTLKLLIFKPGELSREFLSGRRVNYITPIRLYIVISIIYFFIASLDFGQKDLVVWKNNNIITANNQDSISLNDAFEIIANDTIQVSNDSLKEEPSEVEYGVKSKMKKLSTIDGQKKLNSLIRDYIPTGMFVLIPLMALLLFGLFHRNTYYYEHLIFSFNLISVIFLIFTISNIIEWFIKSDIIDSAMSLLILFSIYIWIKSFYQIGYFKTLWKMLIFLLGYAFLLLLFFAIIGFISFLNLE